MEKTIFSLILNDKYAPAWLLLSKQEDSISTKYNKALCLFELGKYDECEQTLVDALIDLEKNLDFDFKGFDEVTKAFLQISKKPEPLTKKIIDEHPEYAKIQVKWLYVILLKRLNKLEKYEVYKRQIDKYNLRRI